MKRPLIVIAALLALAALPMNPVMASAASTNDDPPIIPDYDPGNGDDPPPGNSGRAPAPGFQPVQDQPSGSQVGSDVSAPAAEPVAADDTEEDTDFASFEEEADGTQEVDEESE